MANSSHIIYPSQMMINLRMLRLLEKQQKVVQLLISVTNSVKKGTFFFCAHSLYCYENTISYHERIINMCYNN